MLSDAYCKLADIQAEPGKEVSFYMVGRHNRDIYDLRYLSYSGTSATVYSAVFSERYAREGSQLKDVPWEGIVCFAKAEEMTQPEFEELVYSFGDDCGVDRKDMNINNYFLNALPGGDMAFQETMLVICVGIGILLCERTCHLQCILSFCRRADTPVWTASDDRHDKEADTQDGTY